MKNKKLKIAASIISLGILINPVSTLINNSNIANAQNNKKTNLSEEHKNYILNKAKEYELSETQINNIITKIENGIILDCMVSSKKPIKIKNISDTESIYYYEDGSAKKQMVLKDEKTKEKIIKKSNEPLISPNSIHGGNVYWGSGFKYTSNALIRNDTFYGNFTFRANYINMGRYGGQITDVYDARYWGIGTYSDVSLWIQERTGNPARAVMTVNWSAPGGIASSLLKLELFVGSYSAWTGK
jgi:hypothetical protein